MYSRLSASSEHGSGGGGEAELVSSHGPPSSDFVVRVKDKEKVVTLSALLTGSSSVGALKAAVSRECGVEIASVRLIFSGKLLTPDDKSLSSFHVKFNSIVHLFPLSLPPTAVPTATSVSSSAAHATEVSAAQATDAAQPIPMVNFAETFQPHAITADQMYLDPYIAQTCREVRLWSLLLLMLSVVTVFNNFNQVSVSGSLGQGSLDEAVFLLDTICSLAGIYVAQLGLASAGTQEFATIKRYVRLLSLLAVVSLVTRALWAADVVLQVRQVLRQAGGDGGDEGDESVPNNLRGGSAASQLEDDVNPSPVLSSTAVTTFGIRAAVICLICAGAWLSCWIRAFRLQFLVGAVIAAHQPPPGMSDDGSGSAVGEAEAQGHVVAAVASSPMHSSGRGGRVSRDAVVQAVMAV